MPFDSKFDDIYKFGIQGAASDVGAYAEKVDEQIFVEGMLDRIFTQISKADVIVADMTGRNPNVFYEVGYAHALDKIVLLLTQDSNDIPFDLKHRQHTVYSGKIDTLRKELGKRLQWAIAESKRRSEGASTELISVTVFGQLITTGIDQDEAPTISGSVPTTEQVFSLPIQLRNDAPETLREITHVYLFTEKEASIVPGRMSRELNLVNPTFGGATFGGAASGRATFVPTQGAATSAVWKTALPEPLDSFTANPIDAPDGLVRQYRLPLTFPALPPGAIEERGLELVFTKGKTEGNAIYRLRLHSQTRFYDYKFRLDIKSGMPAPEEP
jgi:hypothetical protein